MEDIIYNLMFYLGRYSVWEELFISEFSKNQKFSTKLLKYEPLIDDSYNLSKNNSGKMNEYEDIKK